MSGTSKNRFHPKQWTVLTWLAILVWAWNPILLNYPPSKSYTYDRATGEITVSGQYGSLSELDFTWGWPFYYVKPNDPPPMPVGAPVPPRPPSTVYPFVMVANGVLAIAAIVALVYVLQTTAYRFSLWVLLSVVTAVPLYFATGRFLAMFLPYRITQWYPVAVFLSPIPVAIAVRYSLFPRVNWSSLQGSCRRWWRKDGDYDTANDALAAASRLEMRGDWVASISLYRHVAERWPQHEDYVQNCIDRIQEKRSLSSDSDEVADQ